MFLKGPISTLIPGILNIATGKPFAFGINISDRCPINCDCYWRMASRVNEMEDEELVRFVWNKKHTNHVVCFLIGGEPYVRPGLLKKVAGIIPVNILVTSGTTPLLSLPRTIHFISVDGRDAETHDRVRKSSGLFQRIVKNLSKARQQKFPAYIHTVLNAVNYDQAEGILEYWSRGGLADGLIFSTITPNSHNPTALDLSDSQREGVVENLLDLKKHYPSFLCNTRRMIELFHPKETKKFNPGRCANAKYFPAFDAAGKKIPKCIFGPDADCTRCGCIVTTYAESLMTPNGFLSALGLGNKFSSVS